LAAGFLAAFFLGVAFFLAAPAALGCRVQGGSRQRQLGSSEIQSRSGALAASMHAAG
jgi:hypothetical protein